MSTPPPLPPSQIPPDPALIARYEAFLLERANRPFRPLRFVIGLILCFTGILILVGLYLMFTSRPRKTASPSLESEIQSARRSVPVAAFPIMVNTLLKKPGSQPAPLLALTSFDSRANTVGFMVRMVDLFTDDSLSPAHKDFLMELFFDEEYTRGRRRQLPLEITDNIPVYAVDLAVNPQYLPNRCISEDHPFLLCIAEPGPQGYIRAIPYWVAVNAQPPPYARQVNALMA